jgi:WD40 repeat protein
MKEHENRFTSEAIERQTERSSDERSQGERRLIQDLYSLSQAYAQENELSLERIWSRFVQSQEYPALLQERQRKESGGKQLFKEEKAMQEKRIHWETGSSILPSRSATRPRHSFWHTLSMGVAAAVVLLTILSWALLSYGLRHRSQPTGSHAGQTTLAGFPQKGISSGELLCSVSYSTNSSLELGQPPLDWSKRGVIATANPFLKTFSAQTCASQSLINLPTTLIRPVWSPDGKRLLLLHGDVADVLDASTGSVLVSLKADRSTNFAQAVWVSNETQIISTDVNVLSHTTQSVKVQVWDASTGALIRTAFTVNDGVLIGSAWISPNGQYFALQKSDHRIEFWNIETGKLVSTTSASVAGNSQSIAWSPDDASLAVGLPNANWPAAPSEVQIWSTATGQLAASFKDNDTFEGSIGGLAWSPNGKYLAESSAEIHIWDIAARKLVTTFGKIATKTTSSNGKTTTFFQISSVTWAPDGNRLASVTSSYVFLPGPGASNQDTLNVWQLS